MGALDQLLVVQDHDTHLDQLRHKRATLPERERIEALVGEGSAVDAQIAEAAGRRHELEREQKRFEDEAQLFEDKASSEDGRLYSGEVTAMKELQAIQDEIAALKRRQTDLEDQALALMESIEPVATQLEALETHRAAIEEQLEALRGELAAGEAAIDAETVEVEAARVAAASDVPAEMLTAYDELRVQFGGVAVARLRGTTCDGCHLGLSAVEVDRLKKEPADAVVHCEECGRILIR